MQSKGAIKFLAIALALVCLFQLSFTFFTRSVEKDAVEYAENSDAAIVAKNLAQGNAAMENFLFDSIKARKEQYYLDSMSNEVIYNFAWIRKYTYKDCKSKELNLGLDLKGGMNVTMEISLPEIIIALSGNNENANFRQAIAKAREMQKSSDQDFIVLFEKSWNEITNNGSLASIFIVGMKDRITFNATNEEVLKVVREEAEGAIDRTFNILRSRIDRFGVTQPNIQKLSTTGRILVELPGIKEPERVRKLLQGTAQLEFWETYEYKDAYQYLDKADKLLLNKFAAGDTATSDSAAVATADSTTAKDTTKTVAETKKPDSAKPAAQGQQTAEQYAKEHPLYALLSPAIVQDEKGSYFPNPGPVVGYCKIIDTAAVGDMLRRPDVKGIFPRNMKLAWTAKPSDENNSVVQLVALKASREGKASLGGDVVIDARQDFGQNNSNEISMTMNSEGAQIWKNLTASNIGNCIAIVLDNYVYSFPRVNTEIPNGRSSITGDFTLEEAKDLANILKAGKLPAPARIVEEAVVGPSLGQEAITSGMYSFIIAFVFIMLYMILYYNKAGLVANLALLTNVFFLFGILASLGAVLTLPGIAGIVLTMGMAVDANVIIYERIREEIRAGKAGRLAMSDGYKHAYSAIIDSNVTTIIAGIVLYVFGSGPVQGFATTLVIGILTTMFSAIFISRLIFEFALNRNWHVNYWNSFTKNLFTNTKINFVGFRPKMYLFSGIVLLIGITSISIRNFSAGVDFAGGRTYVVRFDKDIQTGDVRSALKAEFGEDMEVKAYGPESQVKITTKYMVNDDSPATDSIIEAKIYNGLKGLYSSPLSYNDFSETKDGKEIGKLSSQKVGPTIADDIRIAAIWAISIALLLIFVYVAIRFKKWQWGLGGVIALIHDSIIVLSLYSLFYGVVPWSMEIDQQTIAVLLTLIGFSINDTVIIFDRIREYQTLYPKRELGMNINSAINSTLGRTINTSGTVAVSLIAMFLFGGEIIRGMTFSLLVGVLIGTYSSIGIATPVAYDFIRMTNKRKERKQAARLASAK